MEPKQGMHIPYAVAPVQCKVAGLCLNHSLHRNICTIDPDDLLIFKVLSDSHDFKAIQDDISNIESWSTDNYLTLNPKKCKYMIISRKKDPPAPVTPLILSGDILSRVDTFKYLGIFLHNKLSWSPHIEAVCSKA